MRDKSYNQQLQEIYAKIPKVACQRKCQNACGVIPVQRPELKKIRKKAQVDIENYLLDGPEGITMMFNAETERCPVLDKEGNCTVYEVRPFMCRLFGAVEGMLCPEGCIAERILSREEVAVLVHQLRQLK
jgi:hypothetical protein